MEPNELVKILNSELFSVKLEIVENEALRDLAKTRPSAKPEVNVRELDRVLKNEVDLEVAQFKLSDPDNILTHPIFSVKPVPVPNELVKVLGKFFISELVRDNEPDTVLNSEVCLVKLEATPSELANNLPMPLF
jgi:hypothetical protein